MKSDELQIYSFQYKLLFISNFLQNYRTMIVYLYCFLISVSNFVYLNIQCIFYTSFCYFEIDCVAWQYTHHMYMYISYLCLSHFKHFLIIKWDSIHCYYFILNILWITTQFNKRHIEIQVRLIHSSLIINGMIYVRCIVINNLFN